MTKNADEIIQKQVMLVDVQTVGVSNSEKVSKELMQLKNHLESFPQLLTNSPDFCSNITKLDQIYKQTKQFVLNSTIYPYGTSGWHILPVTSFEAFRKGISEIKIIYDSCLKNIITDYEKIYEMSQTSYSIKNIKHEFPEPDYLKSQLELKINIESIPQIEEQKEQITDLTDEELQKIEKNDQSVTEELNKTLKTTHEKLTKEMIARIKEIAPLVRKSRSKKVREFASQGLLATLKYAQQTNLTPDWREPRKGELDPRAEEIFNKIEKIRQRNNPKDCILLDEEIDEFENIIQNVLDYLKENK